MAKKATYELKASAPLSYSPSLIGPTGEVGPLGPNDSALPLASGYSPLSGESDEMALGTSTVTPAADPATESSADRVSELPAAETPASSPAASEAPAVSPESATVAEPTSVASRPPKRLINDLRRHDPVGYRTCAASGRRLPLSEFSSPKAEVSKQYE